MHLSSRAKLLIGLAIVVVLAAYVYQALGPSVWSKVTPQIPQIFIDTLLLGNLYFLIAVGITMTFTVAKFANFAHGDVATVGAYAAYLLYNFAVLSGAPNGFAVQVGLVGVVSGIILTLAYLKTKNSTLMVLGPALLVMGAVVLFACYTGANLWEATIEAMLASAVVSLLSHVLVYKPLSNRGASLVQLMVASIGVALFIRYALYEMTWYSRQYFKQEITYQNFGVQLSNFQAWIINGTLVIANTTASFASEYIPAIKIGAGGIAFTKLNALDVMFKFPQPVLSFTDLYIWSTLTVLAVIIGMTLLFKKTKIGKAWRAVANNPVLAAACGIDVDSVVNLAWLVAGALAGIGGLFWAIQTQIYPELGWMILLNAFAVAVLGGLGSFWGTFAASYILAFAEQFGVSVLAAINPQYTGYRFMIPFSVFLLVLYLKPEGLAGIKTRKA
ncbi:hypothetical protein IPA_09710 [Ignicoccus pacificus DSM 13166]|uniref:Branched-chain amino acid ABC transporter permease n=1 Tax=Ignicoccus pacificus DSM 13166 TaxID=940294 RepID=A0A977KC66_9CREN|nr:hypothetical protein IPA_09710 [Ignicoccus pacificus DSM 13166]